MTSTTTSNTTRRSVLITGAAGYLGKLLCDELCRDPRGFGRIVASDVREAAGELPEAIAFEKLDIRDGEALGRIVETYEIDTIVHLAAVVTPPPGMSDEVAYAIDVEGTRNVLEACVAGGVRKVIVTSSGAAYGYHADSRALLDEDCPLRGNDEFAYSRHKRLVEELLLEYRREHPELEQLVLRPGTILGPSVKNQITAIFERPVVLGLREAATPFCFVWDRDVVACLLAGVHGDHSGVFNVSGEGVMTLREIAERLGKRYVALPASVVRGALSALARLGLTRLGPEQVRFLQYRPVLDASRLRQLGVFPASSREAFEIYCAGRQEQTHA
ncbi:MAG: SDR family oxidoreductase [Myxococcales bacterium]|nr:SDR family oxidoreductase [Myxococcales bacterium]